MNSKNLPLKFALFVLLPIILSIVVLDQKGLQKGIDLRGGHSLVFEIRTNDREIQDLQAQAKKLEQEIATASPAEKPKLQKDLDDVNANVKRVKESQGDEANLPERIIAILKNRIDPHGLLSLEWRPMGRNRIEVRMPAGREETQKLQLAYLDAITKLEAGNIQPSSIARVVATTGPARQEQISSLKTDSQQAKQLETLASLRDQMNQLQAQIADITKQMQDGKVSAQDGMAKRSQAQAKLGNLRMDYGTAMEALQKANINAASLQATLRLYVSKPEQETLKKDDTRNRTDQFDKAIKALRDSHPSRVAEIDDTINKYKLWADSRQGLDDPSDLKRLIAKSGVLEFRIAPLNRPDRNYPNALVIAPEVSQRYIRDLQENGPDAGKRRNDEFLWFPIRADREGYESFVISNWGGKDYVLLYNRDPHQLLHGGAESWRLTSAHPTNDQFGRPAIGFNFDPRGAKQFFALTDSHKDCPMAILLDDEIYSAPYIRSAISDSGIIEGKFSDSEVQDLVKTLEAGSLPARLATEDTPSGKIAKPASENTFGPSFGAQNLEKASYAGLIGIIAVSVFMIGYYRFAGLVAVVAVLMNLLLTLGVMGMFNAVLTLPGIAGIILAVGMAVDANVLIYERLREEQEKGQSVRMALKNAYDRAFTAIFDSNISHLLSCLILAWLGSEEIRGFAITLGLGVIFNLFTAVTVTRWIFQWMLEKRLIKKPLHLTKLIGVPNIDWIGKRYYFWAFSGITMVLGLAALFWHGHASDIWGIEFSSGTQSIIRFHDDTVLNYMGKNVLPDDGKVNDLFKDKAVSLGYEKLKDTAKVEQILDPNHLSNFLEANFKTTEPKITAAQWKQAKLRDEAFKLLDTNGNGVLDKDELAKLPTNVYQIATTESRANVVSEVARAAFGKEIAVRSQLKFDKQPAGKVEKMGIEVGPSGSAKITPELRDAAEKSFATYLSDFEGGLVFVIQNVNPAVTNAEMIQRISRVRSQPDYSAQMLNPTKVLDLNPAADGTATQFAILVRPAEPIGRNEAAFNEFRDRESQLLTDALTREEALETTNFDAAIAGEMALKAGGAVFLAWVVMMAFLWVRFGQIRWGIAAIVCIFHDLTIMVGMVALSGWLYQTSIGKALLIEPFKIDLTMIAALLTIIGYSVTDTIVVFDRIRENRGKLQTVSPQIINHSINQTLSRTILTPTTVLLTVLIMYIWGGPGIHAFNYAMLIGILFGTYSSIAVAAPLLLGFKEAVLHHAAEPAVSVAK